MFGNSKDSKSQFIKQAQLDRQKRTEQRLQNEAIIKIQALVRMFICSRKFKRDIRAGIDECFVDEPPGKLITALELFKQARKLLLIYEAKQDEQRLQLLCKAIVQNLEIGKEPKYWYMSVMLMKDWTVLWISQLKKILQLCSIHLRTVKPRIRSSNKAGSIYLTMLVVFTDCGQWKILNMKGGENIKPFMQQLCTSVITELNSRGFLVTMKEYLCNGLSHKEISLNQISLTAVTTLIIRSLTAMKSGSADMLLILNVMTTPAYIYHLEKVSTDGMVLLQNYECYRKVLSSLSNYNNMATVYATVTANQCLCLIGNVVDLCMINIERFHDYKDQFKLVVSGLIKHCQTFSCSGGGNSKWHPLLGWHQDNSKMSTSSSDMTFVHVINQIKKLWKQPLVGKFFENLPTLEESELMITSTNEIESTGGKLRRAFLKAFKKSSNEVVDINEPIVMDICMSCDLYQTLTSTLKQVKLEIVADISLQEEILVRLWRFIYSLGPGAGIKSILNYVNGNTTALPTPLKSLLVLFFECSSQLVPILDDIELYEKQKPFSIDDLVKLSAFLNSLIFKLIWNEPERSQIKSKIERDDKIKTSALILLWLLYSRDNRRKYTPSGHWLIKELRLSQFHSELKEKKERALSILTDIPHIIPHMERVKLFHQLVEDDKKSLGIDKEYSRASALISVNRTRLLEDGYEQLHRFTGSQLKGIIRVKFINEQGLDEAGIDQDGVFKEFLEDVIIKAFNPQLNLFKMTTGGDEQRLYPSTTSFIHENHLQLFEFIGKMLGKALYEGILVDVPFASFFLNFMLRQHQSVLYSSIDELPSLDPEMYKNLNFIKNYEGDMTDLQLVFAYDEDILGQMVTHDLKPGGRSMQVTNSNKLTYIHLMGRFRLHTQIKDQTTAFIRGFNSIISLDWLSIFSGPELQRLISGDSGSFDLTDLKSNTSYYGGYHANHQTISWLWDILIREFTLQEKKQFLKFVTSCSNPPLLGFKYLEPQFSIRFVDCSEEEDTGDSVGSVVRGLFNVRRRSAPSSTARLPTASTCFNLLKLPCYKKKTVLRDKLRYAIKSGAGFELS